MRNRLAQIVLLLALVMAVVAIVPIAAADDPPPPRWIVLWAPDGYTFHATTEQSLIITQGWVATTKGLVNVYVRNTDEYLTMSGQNGTIVELGPAELDAMYPPYEQVPDSYMGISCPEPTLWGAQWYLNHDPLPAGTYTITYTGDFVHPVQDGFMTCTLLDTGEPAAEPPGLYSGVYTSNFTLIVDEAP